MSKPDWDGMYKTCTETEPKLRELLAAWLKDHPAWLDEPDYFSFDGILLMNFPPRILVRLCAHGLTTLSDSRLDEVGQLSTQICNQFGLKARMYHGHKSNVVEYTFTVPFQKP